MKFSLQLLLFFSLICSQSFAGIVILNGLTHTHDGAKGTKIKGTIKVQNNGKKEAKIIVYHEDLMASCDKAYDYNKINSHNRSLGSWIKTNVEEKLLQSNEIYTISYDIDVPSDLSQDGSYWSVIMIEGADPIKEDIEHGVKIDSKVRYAVQVIANIGIIEQGKLGFENIVFTPIDSASHSLKIKMKNNGSFVAKTKLTLEIYDNSGKKIRTLESVLRRVYPEKCNDFEILVKDLPKGSYDGVVIADNGKDLYGANVTLAIE